MAALSSSRTTQWPNYWEHSKLKSESENRMNERETESRSKTSSDEKYQVDDDGIVKRPTGYRLASA